jgi:predicted phage terminase large subunit-like protein
MLSLPRRYEIDREMVRRFGLLEFARRAWPIVEPGVAFQGNWHQDLMCNCAMACVAGLPGALEQIVNVPPGTGKSLFMSVFLPSWIWTERPEFCSIYASYDIGISCRDAERTLKIIESPWYQACWPEVRLDMRGGRPAVTNYANTRGGFRFSTSVESTVTGRHGDLRVFDDPIKPLDAMGARAIGRKQLDKVDEWWRGTMSSRNKDPANARYLGIMQRLHQKDLSGILLQRDHPMHVCLPMRFEPSRACVTPYGSDPRTVEGELLWQARYPESAVHSLESALGSHARAQLQQDPADPKGITFKTEWLRTWTELPPLNRVVLSVDCSFKDTEGCDDVAIGKWGDARPNYHLLDEFAERLSFERTVEVLLSIIQSDPRIGAILIEDKANGPAVISMLKKTVPGVIPVNPSGGKTARANAVTYLHRAGNVYYPDERDYPWVVKHREQILGFPRAEHDDCVDQETQALMYMAGAGLTTWEAMQARAAHSS